MRYSQPPVPVSECLRLGLSLERVAPAKGARKPATHDKKSNNPKPRITSGVTFCSATE